MAKVEFQREPRAYGTRAVGRDGSVAGTSMAILYDEAPALMGNFTCQLGWPRGSQTFGEHHSGRVCEGVSGRDRHVNQWTESGRWPSPVWVGLVQSTEQNARQEPSGSVSLGSLHDPLHSFLLTSSVKRSKGVGLGSAG